jgi:hypothetical protein
MKQERKERLPGSGLGLLICMPPRLRENQDRAGTGLVCDEGVIVVDDTIGEGGLSIVSFAGIEHPAFRETSNVKRDS